MADRAQSSQPAAQAAFARRPGVSYAQTAQGQDLPIIDVSHPAFALADDAGAIESLRAQFRRQDRRSRRMPRFLLQYFMRSAVKRSALVRGMLVQGAAVLPGMSTYVIKLGADNLVPPFDTRMDRRFAAAPAIHSLRIRLQQTAKLLVRGLEPELAGRPGVALHLINIGGGSAIDSLNALLLLRRSAAQLLQRKVLIHVLDPDTHGPLFAGRALASLSAGGAPLNAVDATLVHSTYDWNSPEPLAQLVRTLAAEGALIAASSEGALFEYASDAAVIANLRALHAAGHGARVVAGSVTRGDDITRQTLQFSPFKLIPRGATAFGELIRGTGFRIAQVEQALMSDQVLLRPD